MDRYVENLIGRKEIIIDVDGTADPTPGNQQLAMSIGHYGQFIISSTEFGMGLSEAADFTMAM